MRPDNAVGTSEISGTIQSEGLKGIAPVTAHQEHPIPGGNRRRDGIDRLPGALPKQFAILEIVAADLVGAVDDDLFATAVTDDQRSAPTRGFVARLPPQLAAIPLVEGHDEVVTLMVPEHDHRVAIKGRRTALPEAIAGAHVAEVLFPEQLALEVVPVETKRTERDDEVLAVSDRRGRGKAVILVMAFVRQLGTR